MTNDELRAAILANPHLHLARAALPTNPEFAIQTIANELGMHLSDDKAAFKAHLAQVAEVCGYSVAFHDETTNPEEPTHHVATAAQEDANAMRAIAVTPTNVVEGSTTLKRGQA